MENVWSMLKHKKFSDELWREAVNTSVYIFNQAPTRSLDGATPYDFWTRIKPNVEHFRVFRTFVNLKMLKEKFKSCST